MPIHCFICESVLIIEEPEVDFAFEFCAFAADYWASRDDQISDYASLI